MKQLFTIFFIFLSGIAFTQDNDVLTYEQYITLVMQEHPIAKQAGLQQQFADAELLKARGAIDPKLKMNYDSKDFDGKDYFNLLKSEILVPTKLGLDIKANFENNSGEYVNAQNTITNNGLYSLGLQMDVLRNWSYNDRKAAFDQAAVFQEMSENQQQLLLNQLVLDASKNYIDWWNAFEKRQIIEENIVLAEKYLENTKQSAALGDKPAIDTLEAQTILFDQLMNYQDVEVQLMKARLKVNNYLWENGSMVSLKSEVKPTNPAIKPSNNQINAEAFTNHPEVQQKALKVDYLSIENRLAKQQLLPEVNLGYFPLIGSDENTVLPANTDVTNYKIGAKFSMPLFRRKEKANLQKSQLKIQETEFDLLDKQNQLFVKWNVEQNNLANYQQQLNLMEQAQENYQALVDAELIRYNYGESSVFLVNKRLEKLLQTQLKMQDIKRKIEEVKLRQLYLGNQLVK